MSQFIHDGMTFTDTLSGVPGIPPLRVTYRPALYSQRMEFQRLAGESADQAAKHLAGMIARHLVAWDAVDHAGNMAPRTGDWVAKLHPSIYGQLVDLVLGYSSPKPADGESDEERDAKN